MNTKRPFTISVTQEHIDAALSDGELSSPITLALRDAGFKSAVTGFESNIVIRLRNSSNEDICTFDIPLPAEAMEFHERFTSGSYCLEPFEFTIKAPQIAKY